MTKQNPIIVVDTNVWVDNYLPDRPNGKASCAFVAFAASSGIALCYPVHILKDIFYFVQRHLKQEARKEGALTQSSAIASRKIAWACINDVRAMAMAVAADESDIWTACEYQPLTDDFEDNLVIAAAERARADYLVTNDEQLLRKSTVPAFTPEDALKVLQVSRWGQRS